MVGIDGVAPEAGALGRVDLEKIRATTPHDIAAQMIEDGEDPSAPSAHYRRHEDQGARAVQASDSAAPAGKRARRRKRARALGAPRTA